MIHPSNKVKYETISRFLRGSLDPKSDTTEPSRSEATKSPPAAVLKLIDTWNEWKVCLNDNKRKRAHIEAISAALRERMTTCTNLRQQAESIRPSSLEAFLTLEKQIDVFYRDDERLRADWAQFDPIKWRMMDKLRDSERVALERVYAARVPVLALMNDALNNLKIGDRVFVPTKTEPYHLAVKEYVVTTSPRRYEDDDGDVCSICIVVPYSTDDFGLFRPPVTLGDLGFSRQMVSQNYDSQQSKSNEKTLQWSCSYIHRHGWHDDGYVRDSAVRQIDFLPRLANLTDNCSKLYLTALFKDIDITIV